MWHQPREPFLLHFRRDMVRQFVGRGALNRRVGECADAVELRLLQKIEQLLEFRFGLAGKADDEGAAQSQLRTNLAPLPDARQHIVRGGRRTSDRKITRLNSSHQKSSYA